MTKEGVCGVEEAMEGLAEFWSEAYLREEKVIKSFKDWEKWVRDENNDCFFIHPEDYKELKAEWIKDYKDSIDRCLDKGPERDWRYAPPHAFFGEASSSTKIVVLLINPRLDTKTDDSQDKAYEQFAHRKPFYPWEEPWNEGDDKGWEWHRRWLWGEHDGYLCKHLSNDGRPKQLKPEEVFQLELFPYPTDKADKFVLTDGRLPSQKKAAALLAALLKEQGESGRIYILPSEAKAEVWEKLLKGFEGSKELIETFEKNAVVKRSPQNQSLTFTNLIYLSELKNAQRASAERLEQMRA